MADRTTDTGTTTEPDPYLAEHVREALARDPRVGELGIDVEIAGDTATLRGTLASPERRQAVAEAVRELLPGHEVRDEMAAPILPEPADGDAEHLP